MKLRDKVNRREFIKGMNQVVLFSAFAGNLSAGTNETLGRFLCTFNGKENGMIYADLDMGVFRYIAQSFDRVPHSPLLLDRSKIQVAGAPKQSKLIYLDVEQQKKGSSQMRVPKGYVFFGHSFLTKDRKRLVTSLKKENVDHASDRYLSEGTIAIYDVLTGGLIKTVPTNLFAHEVSPLQQSDQALTLGGGKICRFSTRTGQILSRKSIINFKEKNRSFVHFFVSDSGLVAAQINTIEEGKRLVDGEVAILDINGNLKSRLKDKKWNKSTPSKINSMCFDPMETFLAATTPQLNQVSFWSLENQKLVKNLEVHGPGGVFLSKNKKYFVVVSLEGVSLFDSQNLKKSKRSFPVNQLFRKLFARGGSYLHHATAI